MTTMLQKVAQDAADNYKPMRLVTRWIVAISIPVPTFMTDAGRQTSLWHEVDIFHTPREAALFADKVAKMHPTLHVGVIREWLDRATFTVDHIIGGGEEDVSHESADQGRGP